MEKIGLILMTTLFLVPLTLAVSPGLHKNSDTVRLIAMSNSPSDKAFYKARGCEIVHELSDFTAIKCPM
ncbi:MAG: hypothetical protein GF368_03825 [Candidatus Aenigmarchaeota archaeon]|nr:hypothetical protein [Candidatus Aenigmarchaeota archaeon]